MNELEIKISELCDLVVHLRSKNETLQAQLQERLDWNKAAIESAGIASAEISRLEAELATHQWKCTSLPPEADTLIAIYNSGDTPSVSLCEYIVGFNLYELGELWLPFPAPAPDEKGVE